MSIVGKVTTGANPTQYYGTLIVTDIKNDDNSAVSIKNTLKFSFLSPAAIEPSAVMPAFTSWQDWAITTENKQISDSDILVQVTVGFPQAYVLSSRDTITIGIGGDLTANPEHVMTSFNFAADGELELNGAVRLVCPAIPDAALANLVPEVVFTSAGGERTTASAQPGGNSTIELTATSYTVGAAKLANDALTVVADVSVSPENITVTQGNTTDVALTFNTVNHYAAVDFMLSGIAELENETVRVQVKNKTTTIQETFETRLDEVTELRYLPTDDVLIFTIDSIAVNNNNISFAIPEVVVTDKLITVTVGQKECTIKPVDSNNFSTLTVSCQTDSPFKQAIPVRLYNATMSYSATLTAEGAFAWPEKIKPGDYTVKVNDFIVDKVVHSVFCVDTINISENAQNTLAIAVEKGANLLVPGFPAFLSFGGLADMTTTNTADCAAARVSSIFKYAGNDGAGDATAFLQDDPATTRTITIARAIEEQLADNQNVLPVMISYTCNLSGGNVKNVLADASAHKYSYANFILTMKIASSYKDEQHPVPAGLIVNADLIGACQQDSLTSDHPVPVREPLQEALAHHGISVAIPAFITDTLKGYIQSVNWLVHTVAPELTFGWVINLWGVGGSQWIYGQESVDRYARLTVDYVNALGVFDEGNAANFMAIDRYEADDLTLRSYYNSYCYGPLEWQRYYQFCGSVSRMLKQPVMPWQIPASRTPLKSDRVQADFDAQHWGTSANYLLGDSEIGSNVEAINDTILDFAFPAHMAALVGATPRDMYQRAGSFDLSQPAYKDFPLLGIFSVLLGGGSTTGVISTVGNPDGWVRDKLNAYRESPVLFQTPEA